MTLIQQQLETLAMTEAEKQGIPVDLFTRLIETESGWNVYAVRYEPNFKRFTTPAPGVVKTTWDTERELQKCSWGLCQIMGYTARLEGWEKPIPQLLGPKPNLELGALYLARLRQRSPGEASWRWAITAYNHSEHWERINPAWWHQGYTAKYHDILSQLGEA